MKRRFFTIFALLLTLLLCLCMAVGCSCNESDDSGNTNPDSETGSVTVGGEKEEESVVVDQILNAKDIHVTKSVTKDSLTHNAYVVLGGVKMSANLNVDSVTFGTAGVYDIEYTFGTLKSQKKLYIYETPTISGQSAFSLEYKNALVSCVGEVTAKDSFNNALDVLVYEDGGMLNDDFSVNVGVFNVKYIAYDRAGQSVTLNSSVTVTSTRTPELTGSFNFDVADTEFGIQLAQADFNEFAFISIDNCVIPKEVISDAGTKKIIDTEYMRSVIIGDEKLEEMGTRQVALRVVTYQGIKSVDMTLSDNAPAQYDISAMFDVFDNKIEVNTQVFYPQIEFLNAYQNINPTITFTKGQTVINHVDNKVTFDQVGVWELKAVIRGIEETKSVTVYKNLGFSDGMVVSADAKLSQRLLTDYTAEVIYVREVMSGKLVARYKAGEQIADFDNVVLGLNKSMRYEVVVEASKGEEKFKQTAQFTVNGANTVSLLGDENAFNVTPNNLSKVSVDYKNKDLGELNGAYYWNPRVTGVTQDDSRIIFNKEKVEGFTGGILSFKMRSSAAINLVITVEPRTELKYYAFSSFWNGAYKTENDESDSKPSGKCTDRLSFYKLDGAKVETNAVALDGVSSNEWYIVEFRLPEQTIPYAELSVFGGTTLYSDVYIADLKISSTSLMADTTVNAKVDYYLDSEVTFDDIWN